ncbi:MAG: efflux RND transporter periplasmic adaptor subunit [Bacteroidales bacterium]|nr:efflux RND transporter periplasmic adaptor subunit [Deltaproteobacteria bacterium]MBL7138578.1 efflux RND transporter periplasmic adaptor subunit [Bacteroidales bacterium]
MKNRIIFLGLLSLFSSLLFLNPGCKSKNEQTKTPPALRVMTIQGTRVPLSINMVGQAEGIPTVEIRARVEGYLENWSFQEGSIVHKGQILFTIEKAEYVNNVDYATADLANKEAAWEYARLNVARLKPLVNTNAISQNDFDVAVTEEKQAKAAMASAQADLQQAKLNLSYTTIASPITGYIGAVQVRPGNLVGRSESTLLATISAVDPIYVNFQMNENNYLSIMSWVLENKEQLKGRKELQDNKTLPVYLTLSNKQTYPYPGTIDFIGREINPATGTIALRAEFPNKDGLIKPGTFSEVTLILGEEDDGIVIPQSSIQPIQDKDFVFILDSANNVTRLPVLAGQHIENMVVIMKGLNIGDRILLEGYQKIRDGMEVTPIMVKDTLTVPDIIK